MELNIESTKLRLIELIMSINDNNALVELERKVHEVSDTSAELIEETPDINLAIKGIRSNVSLEDIDREQNYRPVSYEEFRKDADKLALDEPIEELLAMLTK